MILMSDEKQTDFSNIRELWTTNIEISKDVYGPTLDDVIIERLQNRIDELNDLIKNEKDFVVSKFKHKTVLGNGIVEHISLICNSNERNPYEQLSDIKAQISECERFKRSLEE